MNRECINNVLEDDVFLYYDKIKCKKIGEFSRGSFVIAPIQEEESINLAKKHGFWENREGISRDCKVIIDSSNIEGVYPIYYAVSGHEQVAIVDLKKVEYKDEKYLFPDVKKL